MKGLIINFRMGRHTKYNNHMILKVDGVSSREAARKLLNKVVKWVSPAGKEIKGKIANVHGNKGALRVIFEKGMPGQSIGNNVEVI